LTVSAYKLIAFNVIIRLMKNNFIKIFATLLLTGAVIGGTAFWVQKNTKRNNLSASLLNSFADIDTDSDGLNDNMESIYGTDYNNPDSDGDGFLDGEEVLSGYDPLKPAPDDRLDTKYTIIPRPAAGSMKDLNFTNDLVAKMSSKVVGGEIVPKKENGAITLENPSSVEEAMQAAIQRSYQEFSPPNIPTEQLNISLDSSDEAIKKYAGEISRTLAPINNVSVIDIDEGKVSMATLVKLCENTASEIKKIKVPSSLTALHKKQIGLLIAQANILRAIYETEEDPLKATIAFNQMDKINNSAAKILTDIEKITF